MSTKKELKLLTELLNLEGVIVYSHRQYEGIGIILQIEEIGKVFVVAAVQKVITHIPHFNFYDMYWSRRLDSLAILPIETR